MLIDIGNSTNRRYKLYSKMSFSTKVGLTMLQKLVILLVTTSLVFSTAMVSVSSKTPSFFPRRQHKQKQLHRRGRGRKNISSKNNNTIIRHVSSSSPSPSPSSELNSHHQEAPWISGFKNSLASGLAAGCSKMLLAPFDIIKTLQQASLATAASTTGTTTTVAAVSKGLSITQAAQVILNRPKGFLEFYSGVGVAVVGSMPSVGLYFGIYSFCKKSFQQWDPEKYEQRQTLYIALSAAIGNTIASASRVPFEVVKQNFQTGAWMSYGDVARNFSLQTFFPTGGIASQMLRDVPYAIVTLLTYEYLKSVWKTRAENHFPNVPVRSWDLLVGGLAGGLGAFVTNPMDVIKTRLQTDALSNRYGGSIITCAELTLKEGKTAFLRGSVPRLLHKVPANAFFFLFYEFFRSLLKVQDDTTATAANTSKKMNR